MERIGKYEIVGELGEGAMGVVYKARDPVLNRFVAVKSLSSSLKADNELRRRFVREAQAVASLNHPNIVTIHDFGEEQGRIFMAMELLEGQDLRDLISSGEPLTLDEKLALMEQVCEGLAFAHTKGIVHRDLKPGNIHIQPNGQVKVLDFGLARLESSTLTRDGLVIGTPNYMSPEQVLGERVDARSDVFSAGAVFYELITNRKPFQADSVHTVMFQVVHKEPAPVRQWAPEVPPGIVAVVERAMAKDRDRRYQNAGELRQAIADLRKSQAAAQSGRGFVPLAIDHGELEEMPAAGPTSPPPAGAGSLAAEPAPPMRPASRPADTASLPPGEVVASVPRPPAPARPGRWHLPLLGAAGLALAGVGMGAVLLLRPGTPQAPPPAPPRPADEVGVLTEALVGTQVELARRDLEDKDYAGAIAQAERALKLSPGHREAADLLTRARAIQGEIESAAGEAREALEAGQTARAAEALSRILALDPAHAAAAELSSRLNESFSAEAQEGRRLMRQALGDAEAARAGDIEAFARGAALARAADALLARKEFASATQQYYQARDAFDRARRAALARGPGAAPAQGGPPAPGGPPASTVALPAPRPPVTVPPATAAPAPPGPRPFSTARTEVSGPPDKASPSGFDTGGVKVAKAPEAQGTIRFEPRPAAPRPGEACTIRVLVQNTGRKDVKVRSVEVLAVLDGTRRVLGPRLLGKGVPRGKLGAVAEVEATMPDRGGFRLEVVVTSERGDTLRSVLEWM